MGFPPPPPPPPHIESGIESASSGCNSVKSSSESCMSPLSGGERTRPTTSMAGTVPHRTPTGHRLTPHLLIQSLREVGCPYDNAPSPTYSSRASGKLVAPMIMTPSPTYSSRASGKLVAPMIMTPSPTYSSRASGKLVAPMIMTPSSSLYPSSSTRSWLRVILE